MKTFDHHTEEPEGQVTVRQIQKILTEKSQSLEHTYGIGFFANFI
ncbi:hypothetical protein [Peribacillus sp. NPDC097895]